VAFSPSESREALWSTGGDRRRRTVQFGAIGGERRSPGAAERGTAGDGSVSDVRYPSAAHLSGCVPPALLEASRERHPNPGLDTHRSREMFHVERERAAGSRAGPGAGVRYSTRAHLGRRPCRRLAPGPRLSRPISASRGHPATYGTDPQHRGSGGGFPGSLRATP
jgi:hypothetical protein